MRKVTILLIMLMMLASSWNAFAQLSGTKTIPGDYATITLAVTDLNTLGVGTGGVTFNIAAGFTESITAPIAITATGATDKPIVFRLDPSTPGTNPKVTRTDLGAFLPTTLGAQGDAVIIIDGGDYITFDKIDVAATDVAAGIEYGYYLRRASTTDGCKNVTIKNAVITMQKGVSNYVAGIYSSNNDVTSLVSSATGITLTSTGGRTENLTITGNTIQNVFAGIVLRGYNHNTYPYNMLDQNVVVGAPGAGNTVLNYAGNSANSSYGVYLIYQTSPTVSYNTINNVGGGGANATSTLYGIFMSSSSTGGNFVANNNALTLGQGSTSGAQGIYVAPTCPSVTISNNTFAFGTFASTSSSNLIYCSNNSPNITVDGNSTVGTITKTGAGSLNGYYNFGTPVGGTVSINNNNFSNIVLTGASTFYGIQHYTSNTSLMSITNNTVSNITAGTSAVYGIFQGYGAAGSTVNGNNVFGISSAGIIYGLYLGSNTAPVSLNAYNNKVYSLSSTGANAVYGIYYVLGTLNNIYKNKVYDISGSNAGSLVYGIYIAAGTTTNVYNNLIGDLRTPAANAALTIAGIYLAGSSFTNLYYNTVYLNATSTGAAFGSTAFYAVSSMNVNLNNNIFVNTSTPVGATGFTTAYRRSANTTLYVYGPSSNNNLFYAGTPGASNLIYYDATNALQTLAAYKAFIGPRDNVSVTENPPFLSTTGTNANFLHINPATASQTESGGAPVTSPAITDDFDGNTRNATTPDIGADEFAGTLLDITAPQISLTPLMNTYSTAPITFVVKVTDISGVPAITPSWPNLYWRINSGAWNAATPTGVAGSNYTFSFGGGVVTGDVVQYYVAAQDNVSPTPNVGTYPSAGAGGFTANPPAASTPPTTPGSYSIITSTPLAGDYTVGTAMFNQITGKNIYFRKVVKKVMKEVDVFVPSQEGQTENQTSADRNENQTIADDSCDHLDVVKKTQEVEEISWIAMENGLPYTGNLYVKKSENPGMSFPRGIMGVYATVTAAVDDLNLRGVGGAVNFLLTDASYTTGETFPINIYINNEYLPTATNKVTIKPNTGVTSTISGAAASSLIFNIFNNYITIDGSNTGGSDRNLTISNTSITSPVVLRFGSIGTTPIANSTLKNCKIINGSNGSSAIVIYASDGTPGYFNNITVQNNKIETAYIGVYSNAIVSAGNGSGLLITGNELNTAGTGSIRMVAIYCQGVDGPTISGNIIGNITNANAESPKTIWLATGTNAATVSGNSISNVTFSNTGAFGLTGIYVSTGSVPSFINITGNSISNLTNSGTSGLFAAIMTFSANTNIVNNSLSNLTQLAATGFWGIVSSGALNSNISGNVVTGMTSATSGAPNGINLQGISTGVNVFNNRISNITNTNTTATASYGLYLTSNAAPTNYLVYDNFIWDVSSYGSSTTVGGNGNGYGIYLSSGIGFKIYHNSINLSANQTFSAGLPACMVIPSTIMAPNSLDIRDNIFSIPATAGTDRYAIICNADISVFSNINYNDYFTSGANIGYLGGVNRPDLAAWQAATLQDANSISVNPNYVSSSDLHIKTYTNTVSGKGYYLAAVTTDIDGDTRLNPPDLGADEYTFIMPTVLDPTNVVATPINAGQINVAFTPNANPNNVVIVWNLTGTFTTPAGTPPSVGGSFAGGTLLYNGLTSPQNHTGLIAQTTYHYKLFSYDGYFYSPGTTTSATTPCVVSSIPLSEYFTELIAGQIPSCWSKSFVGNANWGTVLSGNAGGSSPEMRFSWSPIFTGLSLLNSPVINTTGQTKLAIKFKQFVDIFGGDFTVGIKTTSNGITWNTIWAINPSANVGPQEKTVIITGGDVGSATFQFAFFFEGYTNNLDYWYIDDVSIFVPVIGTLEGTVTAASAKGPIEGAVVHSGAWTTTTNAAGYYSFPEILAGNYTFTCDAAGYMSASSPVTITGSATTTQNFALTFPLIQVDPLTLTQALEPEQTANQVLHISNVGGTAPLSWNATIAISPSDQGNVSSVPLEFDRPVETTNNNLVTDMSPATSTVKTDVTDAPWDIAFSWNTYGGGEVGIETNGLNFYTSTWSLSGVFSKYTMAGGFIESFTISGVGAIRDLAYDGQYFYGGAAASTIYILDLANKTLVGTITAATEVGGVRHISYDPQFDGFWCGNWTTLYRINRAGAIQSAGPLVASVYGSAYDGYSEGGPYLWLNAQVAVTGCGTSYDLVQAQQYKISTNSLTGVTHCQTDIPGYFPGNATTSTITGGMCSSDMVIPGKFILVTNIQQTPNLVGGYELCNTISWVGLDSYSGTVAPGATQNVNVNFDAAGLRDPSNLSTTITINHNALPQTKGSINIPVSLNVAWSGPPAAASNPNPANGFNLVPIQPVFSWTNGARTDSTRIKIIKPPFTIIYQSPYFVGNSWDAASINLKLLKQITYNWQITCKNPQGATASTNWSFTTKGEGTINGYVTDAFTGLPLQGVTITADELRSLTTTTGANGFYEILKVPEGAYSLKAEFADYVTQTAQISVHPNLITTQNFALNLYLDPPNSLQAQVFDYFNIHLTWQPPMIYSDRSVGLNGTTSTRPSEVSDTENADISEFPGIPLKEINSSNNIHDNGRAVLFDNVNMITGQCSSTSAQESSIIAPSTLYGSSYNLTAGFTVADNFTIPTGKTWQINNLEIFGYQTGSTTTSTFTGAYVRIWKGSPIAGGAVVWGDLTTNLMSSTSFTGIFRISATTSCNTQRPVMKIVASTPGLVLTPGSYYVEFGTTGTLASGPWVPTISAGASGTALQYTTTGWVLITSPDASNTHEVPFILNGDEVNGTLPDNLLGFNVYRNNNLIQYVPLARTMNYSDNGLAAGTYDYKVSAVYVEGESATDGPVIKHIMPAPTLVTAEQSGLKVYLEWESNQEDVGKPFSTYYNVFRNGVDIADVYGTTYSDENVVLGSTYCYKISEVVGVGPAYQTGLSNEECVTMVCPVPTNLYAGNLAQYSADLHWTAGSNETSWNVLYGPAGFNPQTSGTLITNVTTTTYHLANLQSFTSYDFYVQAHCSANYLSDFSGPANFKTLMCDLACEYTFNLTDSFGDGWNGATMQVIQNGYVVAELGAGFTTGLIYTQLVSICHGISFSVYWNAPGSYPEEVGLQVVDPFGAVIYTLVPNTGGVGTTLYTGTGDCTPPCPVPSALTATNITPTSALLGWTSTGSEWNLEYGVTGFNQGSGTHINGVTSNPYLLGNLNPTTSYSFYVQTVCGNEQSAWAGPYTFTTLVPSIVIPMPQGWNGWSSPVAPVSKATFAGVVAPVAADMIISQYFGQLYWPLYGINTMGDFSNAHGYLTKMSVAKTLTITGEYASPTISLDAGWNLIPVISTCNIAATQLGTIPGFVIAVEIAGNGIYYPAAGINTLVSLVPGKAYYIKTTVGGNFTFPICGADNSYSYSKPVRSKNITNWNDVNYTGVSHAVIFSESAVSNLVNGDVIGAFTNGGLCAGMTIVDANTMGMSLFADDISTSDVDGFAEGEALNFRVFRPSTSEEHTLEVTFNTQSPNYDGLFATNGLSVVDNFTMSITGINNQSLNGLSIYPNPSNGIFNIAIHGMDNNIDYVITNAQGQQVINGKLLNSQEIDLSAQPKGIYFIKFTGDNVLRIEKVVVK